MRFLARGVGFIAVLALAGCATVLGSGATNRELLQPWIEVSGAQMSSSKALNTDYIVFRRPDAISAQGNDLYLVDAGLRRIFRYDRMLQTLAPFAANLPVEAGMSIHAAADQSVYIALPSSGKVLHYTRSGISLPTLAAPGILARPVSVAVNERNGTVLVVDTLRNQLVVFSGTGGVLAVIKPLQVQSISAIAAAPSGGVYVIDRLARRIVALGWDGSFRFAFGEDAASDPGSIAVSRDNLVFVGDNFDNTIRVFSLRGAGAARLVGKIGGAGVTSTSFNGIGGLAVEDDMLYVSDSLNGRIQSLLINPNAIDTAR